MFAGKSKLLFSGLSLIGIFLLIGCGARPTASLTPTPTETPTASVTPTALLTNTPTVTPTETATFEPTPTSPPYTRCQEIIDAQLPKDFLTEGSIIFDGECEGREGLFKLSADTRKIEPFLGDFVRRQYNYGVRLSPDHQWLAIDEPVYDEYSNYLYSTLIITGENDQNIIRYTGNREWDWQKDWLGNQKLRISMWRAGIPEVFLDVFSGQISYLDRFHGWSYYDSNLTRALSYSGKTNSYALFNMKTGRELWKSKENLMQPTYYYHPSGDPHIWSPDDNMVAFPVWDNENSDSENNRFVFRFMVITRDGQEILSQPVQSFGYIFYLDQKPNISFDWSKDSQYLIYWNATENGTNHLIYWNPLTNEINEPKFTISDNDVDFPDFSPDEQKFILNAKISSDEYAKTTNYLVDFSTGRVSQLDIDLHPLAWIKTNQEVIESEQKFSPLPPRIGSSVRQTCLETQTGEVRPKLPGALVFSNGRFYNNLYTFTDDRGVASLIEPDTIPYQTGSAISPDRQWLFYWYMDQDSGRNYWLYSLAEQSSRVTLSATASDSVWYGENLVRWQNNNEIQIGWVGNSFRFLNPFTKEYREAPEFPNTDMLWVCNDDSRCHVDKTDFRPYDNNFERLLYVNGGGYVLIDRAGNFLWDYRGPLAGFNLPKWQPGDQKLAIPMPKNEQDVLGEHYEIFTVNRVGQQRRLTNYSTVYPTMSIDQFSWSPDGRYIAFWGNTHPEENAAQKDPYRLFVLDTITQKTVDYCVSGSYSSNYTQNHAPVWSPDGNQIAVESIQSGKQIIMLVDFASGTVSPVAEGELVGWMAEP